MNELRAFFDHPAVLALAGTVVYLYVFWLLYVCVMGLYRASLAGRLTGAAKWLAYPVVIAGVVVDWWANVTVATLVFQEPPRSIDELVTGRLARYIDGPECRNKRWALAICRGLLDAFDPSGDHCGIDK